MVADGKGDSVIDGVAIHDVGAWTGRVDRMFRVTRRAFEKARNLDADIYHLHDPELIPAGRKLKRLGKKVIFDSHEDVPEQMMAKRYLSLPARYFLSYTYGIYERFVSGAFDAIVTATPTIREKFEAIVPRVLDVRNYPIVGELSTENDWSAKSNSVCYVGTISLVRGIREMVSALECVSSDIRLVLAGEFCESDVEASVKKQAGWKAVEELGLVSRMDVRRTLDQSIGGLVVLHPVVNHVNAMPIKMFEYMSAGVPVIASNFPLWRKIVEENDCGLCVDPLNHKAIAEAIDFLAANPERAKRMGENGRRAVQERFNWAVEEKKLLGLYNELASEC